MTLMLNDLFKLSEDELKNSKIELNMTAGSGEIPLIDRWLSFDYNTKLNGTGNCSYWTSYGKSKNFYTGNKVFSFVRMSNYTEWLFVSAAEIIGKVEPDTHANVRILEEYKPYFGRLIIKHKKGNTFSRYVFNFFERIDNCEVKEILPVIYDGKEFDGYDNLCLPYRQLEDIFNNKIMHSYYSALQKITGVYCLTDTNNGKLYIGSAYGSGGVSKRWGDYLNSQHGNNKKLIQLYKEEGKDYFQKYFTFTLLEYFGMSYDKDKIIEREQYWKRCFDTIKNGYNDN